MSAFTVVPNALIFMLLTAIAIANFVLGIIVLARAWKKQVSILFFFLCVFISGWAFGLGLLWSTLNVVIRMFGAKLTVFSALYIPLIFFLFSETFPSRKLTLSKPAMFAVAIPSVLLSWLFFANKLMDTSVIQGNLVVVSLTFLHYFYFLNYFVFFLFSGLIMIREYRKSSTVEKIRYRYFLLGLLLAAAIGIGVNQIMLILNFHDLIYIGPLGSVFLLGFTSYAILKYRLMDISLVIKKTTAYSLVTAGITALYVILILSIERFLQVTFGYEYLLTAIIAALFIVVTFEPMRTRLQAVVDRIFFRRTYEYQKVVREVTKLVSSVIDLRTLFRLIDRTIVRVMCIKTAAVLLLEEKKSHYIVEKTNGLPNTIMGIKMALDNPLIIYLKEYRDAAVIDELRAKMESGSVEENEKERLKTVVYEMEKLNSVVVIPSFLKEHLVGILALGEKLSGELYSPDDIELLMTLAQEASIAIENAKLYRDISETRDYLHSLVEGSEDGIITLDLLGTVLTWNQGASKIFGYESSEVVGKHPPFFGEEEVKHFVGALISKKDLKSIRIAKKSRDNKLIPLLMTLSPINNSEGRTIAFSCILKDISELEKVESMKNEFFSIVSHELRTPLTPLLDYIELFREGMLGDLNDKQKNVLEKLRNLGRRELNLVNSILDFARLERGSFKMLKTPVNMKVFLKEVVDTVKPGAFGKSQKITDDISDKMPVIMAEENLLSRLFLQLFDNAIKFTPRGGEMHYKAYPKPGGVIVEVSDNGIGVPREKLDEIFQKFYQVDSSHTREVGGMGLGLAICKQIVQAHGGTISAESKGVGKGLTITVFLPLD